MKHTAKASNTRLVAPDFTHFIVVFNPASTHAKQGRRRITELRRAVRGRPVTVVETSPDGQEATIAVLYAKRRLLGKNSLLCIVAGDGTTASIIEHLMTDDRLSAARETPILPLWGGNANDLAHMLNGRSYRIRLRRLLADGRIVPVYPLLCTITTNQETTVRVAACYASFGATALAAHRLNQPAHRHSPWKRLPGGKVLQELVTVSGALLDSGPFAIREGNGKRLVYERTFSNGPRFAGFQRLPVRLNQRLFFLHTMESERLLATLLRLSEALRNKKPDAGHTGRKTTFTIGRSIWAQFDGEASRIPANATVTITVSEQPFYALSTLIRPAVETVATEIRMPTTNH